MTFDVHAVTSSFKINRFFRYKIISLGKCYIHEFNFIYQIDKIIVNKKLNMLVKVDRQINVSRFIIYFEQVKIY